MNYVSNFLAGALIHPPFFAASPTKFSLRKDWSTHSISITSIYVRHSWLNITKLMKTRDKENEKFYEVHN